MYSHWHGFIVYLECEWHSLAKNPIKLEPDIEKKVLSFIDLLEENDDIQRVFTNINFNQDLEEK